MESRARLKNHPRGEDQGNFFAPFLNLIRSCLVDEITI